MLNGASAAKALLYCICWIKISAACRRRSTAAEAEFVFSALVSKALGSVVLGSILARVLGVL